MHSVIAELEDAIQSGSKEKRVDALRRITDLFVSDADRLNDQQIVVFDDVLGVLVKRIEGKALSELSRRLGPIKNAPSEVVRSLARNDDITIAEPILTQSRRLSETDLIEIANTKAQAHLLAISGRTQIGTSVTDVLLQRGDRQVFHKLAENSGANFSENGFATLVKHSAGDDGLAEKVGLRVDVPIRLFQELLSRATEAVRARLLAAAGPESRENIRSVLAAISEDTRHEAGIQYGHEHTKAHAKILALRSSGQLNEAVVFEAAKADRYVEVIAAIAVLSEAPMQLVESIMQSENREAFLIPCKAARLEWPTVRVMLSSRHSNHPKSDQEIDSARIDYQKLSASTAARALRFWQVRQNTAKDAAAPAQNRRAS